MSKNQIYIEDVERIANKSLPWEKFAGKTVAITGATGLVSSMLIDVLMYRNQVFQDNIKVIAVSRSLDRIRKYFTDYLDLENFSFVIHQANQKPAEMGDVDVIFHGSGHTVPDAFLMDQIGTVTQNVWGTHLVLQYASTHHVERFICFSGVEVYGTNRGDTGRFVEDYCGYLDCNSAKAGLAESRRLTESICEAYGDQYGMEVCIARFSNIYGPNMSLEDSRDIARHIFRAIKGQDLLLKGNREEIYSYCYSADAVSAVLHIAMKGENGQAYNIANNQEPLNAKQLAEKIARLGNVSVKESENVEKPFRIGKSYANNFLMDTGKIQKLGWKPETDITKGLSKTIEACKPGA